MGVLISIDDFEVGRFKIAVNPKQELDLETVITDVEAKYMPMLFGIDLNDLFDADLVAGIPQTARFKKVYYPLMEQNECVMVQSIGIVDMLKGFVYYLYLRDIVSRSTTVDLSKALGENSEGVGAIGHDITSRWNESVDTFKTIQYYMADYNMTDYPEFKGIDLQFSNIF
jgi:hypothetical protein